MLLTIGTWNIKGLSSPQKRQKTWKYVSDHHLDVVAIQETHLARTETTRFQHKHFPLIFYSSASTKHRGVALLFRSSTKFQPLDTQHDKEGRWLMVKGRLLGRLCSFVVVYAPNTGQTAFLERLLSRMVDLIEGPLFLMGGFQFGEAERFGQLTCTSLRLGCFLLIHSQYSPECGAARCMAYTIPLDERLYFLLPCSSVLFKIRLYFP